jgi:methylmalonyl-CoA mutase N-terminal domain/subunit
LEVPLLRIDPEGYRRQCSRLARLRAERDGAAVAHALDNLRQAARGTENVMGYILRAVRAHATLQEATDVLREVFGTYREASFV